MATATQGANLLAAPSAMAAGLDGGAVQVDRDADRGYLAVAR